MSDGNKMIRDQMCELADNQTLRRERQEMSAEIERLRGIVRFKDENLDYSAKNIGRLQGRIEELEDALRAAVEHHCKGIYITTDQIRAAWRAVEEEGDWLSPKVIAGLRLAIFRPLNIVRCEGCGGSKKLQLRGPGDYGVCPDCNGEGFKIGGGDE